MTSELDGRPTRPGFAARLLIAQSLVLVAGAATSWLVATSLGPGIFSDHLEQAGVAHTPSETAHIEDAFASAMVLALMVAAVVSMAIALAVSWFFTRRVQQSIRTVVHAAARIATGDYRVRATSPGLGAEFDLLASTINKLTERLETVETTRRRMLADLAHEMRTPLATIDAYLEAIEDGVRVPDTDNLAVIKSSTDRLGRLAGDIAAVSQAEEGQLSVDLERVLPADLVRAAVSAAGAAAAEKHIALSEQLETGAQRVLADPARMGQVLGNLLDNAVRHTPEGGRIVVSSRPGAGEVVELAVSDSGDGIAPEHLGHVFDRFYRADTARNRAQGGSGIGLTISRAIVEAHGGQVIVSSAGPGHGSTFVVRLPVAT